MLIKEITRILKSMFDEYQTGRKFGVWVSAVSYPKSMTTRPPEFEKIREEIKAHIQLTLKDERVRKSFPDFPDFEVREINYKTGMKKWTWWVTFKLQEIIKDRGIDSYKIRKV